MITTDYLYTGIIQNPNTCEIFEIYDNSIKNLKIRLIKLRKSLSSYINEPCNELNIIIHISDNKKAIRYNRDSYPIYTRIVRPSKFDDKGKLILRGYSRTLIDISDNYKSFKR